MQRRFLEILSADIDTRRALFETTAARLKTRAENIEKDLYVCWILDFLFNRRPDDGVRLYFKGGTSLSKAFGLIQRFSEDIDIGVYKADINAPLEAEIAALASNNQRDRVLRERVDEAARAYISGPLKTALDAELANTAAKIGDTDHFSTRFDFDDYRQTDALDILIVTYKSAFDASDGYVVPAVRIEGGARPDPVPAEPRTILPYVAPEMGNPEALAVPNVTTVRPERTFWEKVLILHAMAETTLKRAAAGDPGRRVPDLNRYSRHYYDIHQIWTADGYGEATAALGELAEAARQHKMLMFRAPDHGYERAVPGTYRLRPTEDMRSRLQRDYARMSAMIFGEAPNFETVMSSVDALEDFVNRGASDG
ncbi:nucleotidyl transferase AbiEii/AbiGii toxin family protein [Asticcacaulis sp. AC402]|uniref:nucleotidyl transferase AbiEii/AbiGii toxin family protein n=1 Tax=Asticcacaulis sp. AC402 TaxID=1282361 RepID=UPI0003C3C624|nr:nucleotidyl transferase AbiEii/AbiGii toxin family protein [Asticcacaulis sp. AC402]ESQ75044.1 hypothetical protein ABAC402_11610 [Asticcacaulis sp. AC402]